MGEVTGKCKHCYADIHIYKNVWYHADSQMGCYGISGFRPKYKGNVAEPALKSDYIKKFNEVWEK